jgi:glutamate dehydrogenase
VDNPFGTDEECAAAALIGTAGKILRSNNRGVPEDFVAELFAHAVVEDLIRHDPNELAELADSIWLSLAERKRGAPKIRFQSHADPVGAERGRSGSVIEIVDDEMPFQVESVLAELAERGIDIRFVVHPTFTVARDDSGRLVAFNGTRAAEEEWREGAWPEIVIAIKVERIDEEAHRAEIVAAIEQVIADVRICVADWRAMVSRVGEVAAEIKAHPPPVPVAEVAEAIDLLDWLPGNNFTYLGIRDYRFTAAEDALEPVLERARPIARARHAARAEPESAPRQHAADAGAAHRQQGRGALARAPARLHGPCGREAVRSRRQARR